MSKRGKTSEIVSNLKIGQVIKKKTYFDRHASRFHILINTNHKFDNQQRLEACIDVLRQATKDLVPPVDAIQRDDLLNFFEWSAHKKIRPIEEKRYDLVDTEKILFVFEFGPVNGYLHEHLDLLIYHRTVVQLNKDKWREYYINKLREAGFDEVKGIFLRIKRVRANISKLYQSKQLPGVSDHTTLERQREAGEQIMSGFITGNDLNDSVRIGINEYFSDPVNALNAISEVSGATELPNPSLSDRR